MTVLHRDWNAFKFSHGKELYTGFTALETAGRFQKRFLMVSWLEDPGQWFPRIT